MAGGRALQPATDVDVAGSTLQPVTISEAVVVQEVTDTPSTGVGNV